MMKIGINLTDAYLLVTNVHSSLARKKCHMQSITYSYSFQITVQKLQLGTLSITHLRLYNLTTF